MPFMAAGHRVDAPVKIDAEFGVEKPLRRCLIPFKVFPIGLVWTGLDAGVDLLELLQKGGSVFLWHVLRGSQASGD
jgi:hypothetical protein